MESGPDYPSTHALYPAINAVEYKVRVKIQPVPYGQQGVFHKNDQAFDAVLASNACFCKKHLEHTNVLCGEDADTLVLTFWRQAFFSNFSTPCI